LVAAALPANATILGSFVRDVNETPLLNVEEEQDLARRVQEGDIEARDHLIRANVRLVIQIARQYQRRGFSLEDLVQEGTLGLMRAVEGFDPERELRFSTYAKYWIVQSMQRLLKTSTRNVRVPPYAADLVVKWRRTATELKHLTGADPSDDLIAARLGLSARKIKLVKKALQIFQGPAAGATEFDAVTMSELADRPSSDPQDRVLQADDVKKILGLLSHMDAREAAVLRLRFGLDGSAPMNLSEIGGRLDLTRERVRQLEKKALAALRERME
jgi:RNA polymerase primary sigma factor